jgi:two-component system cell cycle sensor histidine kinase/response regulator CckA
MSAKVCLLVDDEPPIRTFLRAILEAEGFQCLEAESAPDALKVIRRIDGRIDLVITDIKMPGEMDGIDLAQSLRMSYPILPVILISGFADEHSSDHTLEEFTFIQKPFAPRAIAEAAAKATRASN